MYTSPGTTTQQTVENSGDVGTVTQTVNIGAVSIKLVPPPTDRAWIERPPYREVKAALLQQGEGHRACVVSAMHGMGGIGKTWLARALANDPAIRKAMGVLWVNVGQGAASSETLMGDLIALLAPSYPRTTTSDGIQAALRGLLAEKPYLLVLDDVWSEEIAAEFVSLFAVDTHSRLLITTRKSWIAEEIGASPFPLDLMTEAESLAMFAKHLDRPLHPEEMNPARQLAGVVKYLPLALSLVIARIKKGQDWKDLYDKLRQNLNALNESAPRRPGQRIEPTLEAVFNTSLDPLRDSPEWRAYWEGCLRLSVLAEDTQITPTLACRLLGDRGQEILELLADEALLIRIHQDGNAYQIHDLLREHARHLLQHLPPQGLGTPLRQAETELLSRYGLEIDRPETFQTAWQLEADGYIHPRLVYHLARLSQLKCIEVALNTETLYKKNGWFQVRESLGQTSGFVADVQQWQRLLRETGRANGQATEPAATLGKEVRCILILSTIRSLAANIPLALIQNLVRFGLWKPEQALTYLRQVGTQNRELETIQALAPYLPPEQALKIAEDISDEQFRAEAIAALVPHLPSKQKNQVIQQALEIAQRIYDERSQVKVLATLAPHLPPPLLQQALKIAQRFHFDQRSQVKALSAIALHFPFEQKSQIIQQALGVAQQISDGWFQVKAVANLAPHLPPEQKDQVIQQSLEIAQRIYDEWFRIKALTVLAPHLPPEQKNQVIQQILENINNIPDEHSYSEALSALVACLPPEQKTQVIQQALEVTQHIYDEHSQAKALTALVPHLPLEQRSYVIQQILEAVQRIYNIPFQAEAMAALAPHCPRDQALDIRCSVK